MKTLFTVFFITCATLSFSQTYSATDSVMLNTINSTGYADNSRGFEFIPNQDITITELGHRLPDSNGVYTWVIYENSGQSVLHQQVSTLPNNPGIYQYEPISTPIILTQGTTYTFSLFHAGTPAGYYYESNTQMNSNLTYVTMRYCNGCVAGTFPSSTLAGYHYGTPDFHFTTCGTPATAVSLTPTACSSYTSPSGNSTWTTSGMYTETIQAVGGCDSIIYSINLTINNNTTDSINVSACGSYPSPGGQTYMTSGLYYDTIPNSNGCDSIIAINLTVNDIYSITQNETALDSYTWSANGQTYTQSGTYTYFGTSTEGCDSTVTLVLSLSYTGLEGLDLGDISVYPNPVKDHLSIKIPEQLVGHQFFITDNNGKIVKQGMLSNLDTKIDIQHLATGYYVIKLDGLDNKSFPMIKE